MTTITHSLVGAAIGCGATYLAPDVFGEQFTISVWILAFVGISNIPDIDVSLFVLPHSIRGDSLLNHRGITHGLPALLVFSALLVLGTGTSLGNWKGGTMMLWFAGTIALHLVCDTLDGSNGICLFAPFSKRKYTTGYRVNDDLPFDVLSSARGRAAFLYGVTIETLLVTLPTSVVFVTLSWMRKGV